MKTPKHNPAFTLIELVVVLLIISLTTALAAPSLRGWSDGAKLRNATDEFLAATQYARSQAILTAREYVVTIDANAYAVSVQEGSSLTPDPREFGDPTPMPTGFTLALTSGGEAPARIRFYPDARTTPGVVRITSARGEVVEIASDAPAMPYKVVGVAP